MVVVAGGAASMTVGMSALGVPVTVGWMEEEDVVGAVPERTLVVEDVEVAVRLAEKGMPVPRPEVNVDRVKVDELLVSRVELMAVSVVDSV